MEPDKSRFDRVQVGPKPGTYPGIPDACGVYQINDACADHVPGGEVVLRAPLRL